MVGRAVRRGGCSTSVCWHLLSSSKRRMADAACQAALIPLCRLAPPSTCLVWLGRGHEGDHHRGPQFTDCVRMVHTTRHCQPRLPTMRSRNLYTAEFRGSTPLGFTSDRYQLYA